MFRVRSLRASASGGRGSAGPSRPRPVRHARRTPPPPPLSPLQGDRVARRPTHAAARQPARGRRSVVAGGGFIFLQIKKNCVKKKISMKKYVYSSEFVCFVKE